MHDSGLLGQMIPEFKAINCRVVRDFYHKYTVDEHTLLTIRNLERLIDAARPSASASRGCSASSKRPSCWCWRCCYTTSASGRDEDHAAESDADGAPAVRPPRSRPTSRATSCEFLVGQHLKMSLVAFRRDTEDPEIVRQFAELVGVEERLKMLCLMTLADVEAVSRETLTPWKEELLWRLYVDTYNFLTLVLRRRSHRPRRRRRSPSSSTGRPDDLVGRADRARFSKGCRGATCSSSRAKRSIATSGWRSDLGPDAVQAWLERSDSGWELTVLTHDQPFLFSNISGVLSSFGMDILRGFAFTKPDGLIVDMFHFTDDERFLELNEGGDAQLIKMLEDVLARRGRRRRPAQGTRRRARSGGGCRASPRSSTATTSRRAATPSSRSWRRTRSACSTA